MDQVDISRNEQPDKSFGGYSGKHVAKGKKKLRLVPILIAVLILAIIGVGISKLVSSLSDYSLSATIANTEPQEEPQQQEAPKEQPQDQTDLPMAGTSIDLPKLAENDYLEEYFGTSNGFLTYESPLFSGKVTVDVSSHQETIDWPMVARSGVQAAVIRVGYRGCTEGAIQADPYFQQNVEGAMSAGLDVSVYFFSQAITEEEAQAEATFVINAIGQYGITGDVFFDWEEVSDDARTVSVDATLLTKIADTFCSCVEASGYSAGIYFNQTFGYERLNLSDLAGYRFWLAEYNDRPTFAYHFDCWQYTNEGTVAGITGNVDMNVLFCKKQ